MYIEQVEYVKKDNQKDYLEEIKQITNLLSNHEIGYRIYESRHNGGDSYIAEISYGYWV